MLRGNIPGVRSEYTDPQLRRSRGPPPTRSPASSNLRASPSQTQADGAANPSLRCGRSAGRDARQRAARPSRKYAHGRDGAGRWEMVRGVRGKSGDPSMSVQSRRSMRQPTSAVAQWILTQRTRYAGLVLAFRSATSTTHGQPTASSRRLRPWGLRNPQERSVSINRGGRHRSIPPAYVYPARRAGAIDQSRIVAAYTQSEHLTQSG